MKFEFATSQRIVFGPGTLSEAGPIAASLGRKALLVTRRSDPATDALRALLDRSWVRHERLRVAGEPTLDSVRAGVRMASDAGCDLVIGFGGGSALDTGKAIAVLLANGGDPLDYIEVIGGGRPFQKPSAPFLAIPTTAGTGSEATRNAVLVSPQQGVKASLRSSTMLPRAAIVDPLLAVGMPRELTAATGLDALTQLIEPFVCTRANPITDALCRDGIRLAVRSLRDACESPYDPRAREDLALASLFGGMALANAGLGAVHGFAAAIGGLFDAPHGAVCARLLAPVIEGNVRALEERLPQSEALARYDEVAILLTGRSDARPSAAVEWLDRLCQDLEVPQLSAYGMKREDFDRVVSQAAAASSMKANPISLTVEELREVLDQAL